MRAIPSGADPATSAPPLQTCQTVSRMSSAPQTMTFKNEVVSDADIDRYNLPFHKGDGRWWTRDAERDYYLWGGLSGNPAFDTEQEGRFYLYVDGEIHLIFLSLAEGSEKMQGNTFIRKWARVLRIIPDPSDIQHETRLIGVLKDALLAYGYDGENDGWCKDISIKISF
ncbi:MAG: hypothetical protein ACK587_14365 [Cyanobacteriota bacterium]